MKIKSIKTFAVAIPVIPIAEGGIAPYRGSQDKVGTTQASSILFKVETDNGIVGWGEMNPIISNKITKTLVEEYISPKLIGRNPFEIKAIMAQFAPVYDPQVNTKSFLPGIQMALWDIMGKALNVPVYDLLGGRVREKIEIAYALGILDIQATQKKIHQIMDAGYQCLKTKGGKEVVFDVARAKAMREAAGPNFEIRVDMNQGYDTIQALRYLREVEDCDLQYVEQPIKVNRLEDMKNLRIRTRTPLAINEDCYIPNNFFRAVKTDAIDAGVIDFEPIGGITELQKIESVAVEAGIPLAHHCGWDMGIKLAAILHVTCTMQAFTYPMDSTYMAHGDDILVKRIEIEDGAYLIPSEGPGFGIVVDEEKIEKLSVKF